MNMNRLYMKSIIWSLLGFLLLVSSCKDEDMGVAYDDGRYREVVLPLSYKVSTSVETRALSTNFEKSCIYQFKSSGEFVTKVDLKSTDNKVALYVPYTEGVTLQCVFIGNASIADVEADGVKVTNLESLLAKHLVINTNYNPGSDDKVLMSGVATVFKATQSLEFTLKPNVAKYTLTINPYSERFNKLFSVQLRHVNNKIHFAHHAFTDEQKKEIHAAYADDENYGKDLIRYESEPLPGPAEYEKYKNGQVKYTWYIPHNYLGDKKPKVDDNQHTFFVISYERNEDWKTVMIPIYLAKRDGKYEDDVTSYEVEAGVEYNVTVTLKNFVEITEENKTVNLEKYVEFPENTNCHILNPNITGVGTVYSIPVSRAWQYWTDLRGQTLSDDYVVDVIWQDINKRVLTFCDSEGSTANGQPQTAFISSENNKGKDSRFYIKLLNDTPGNVLIGIKANAQSTEYLWSWHIWITDYNPNDVPVAKNEYPEHVFTVPGGELHRYEDPFNWVNGQRVYVNDGVFWSKTEESKGVYMMDRNLGAYSNKPEPTLRKFINAGMYYQYGRKDPFPPSHISDDRELPESVTPLYKIDGSTRIQPIATGLASTAGVYDCVKGHSNREFNDEVTSLNYSVKHPDVFIYRDATKGDDWVVDNKHYMNNWNNPVARAMDTKSIFDPCPLGWRISRMGSILIFSSGFKDAEILGNTYKSGNFKVGETTVTDRYFYYEQPGTDMNGDFIFSDILNTDFLGWKFYINDYKKGATAYYPPTNFRDLASGPLVTTTAVCNWSIDGGLGADQYGEGHKDYNRLDRKDYGYHIDGRYNGVDNTLYLPDAAGRAYCLPVRCIKETKF